MPSSYFVRITPREPITYEDIESFLDNIRINQWVICFEQGSKNGTDHYHLCLFSERGPENMRFHFKQHFNAQVYISGKNIEDKVRAVAYCFKDGNYRQKNLDYNTFLMAKSIAHKKAKFEDDIRDLDLNKTERQILEDIIDLHVKYNRKIYKPHIKALFDLIRLKKGGKTYRDILVKDILGEY